MFFIIVRIRWLSQREIFCMSVHSISFICKKQCVQTPDLQPITGQQYWARLLHLISLKFSISGDGTWQQHCIYLLYDVKSGTLWSLQWIRDWPPMYFKKYTECSLFDGCLICIKTNILTFDLSRDDTWIAGRN